MSGPSSNVGRVDRLTSQVEFDAMPDACGRPPPFLNNPNWTTDTGGKSSPSHYTERESVSRGTGQVYETSEGSAGGSEQIPSGRSQKYSQHVPPSGSLSNIIYDDEFMNNYTFYYRYSSSELQTFFKRLQIVRKQFERLPDNLKTAYFDVMVLYSEDDRTDAQSFCQSLNDLNLENGKRVKAVLYDVMDFANAKRRMFGSLEIAFERCTFAFVYLTKQFCKCEWSQIASEECLMEAIYNKDKRWCVVPVHTVQRTKADFRVPMGLNSLKGINLYNNDDFYRRGLQKLIGGKIYKREDNEEKLFSEQYECALQLEKEMQMEAQQRQWKLEEAELQKSHPSSSSIEKEEYCSHKSSYNPDSSESLENLDKRMQSDVDTGVSAAGQFPLQQDSKRSLSSFQSESSLSGYPSEGSVRSMSYSVDGQKSDINQASNDLSLQADMAFSHQSKVPTVKAGKMISESGLFDEATGGNPELDKDGKVVVHHIHTHTHIYADKEPQKSKKNVVNIYGAENVVIGDHNTVVEGGTPFNAGASDKGREMSANSRKKPDCNRDKRPSLSSQKSVDGPNTQSMEGANQPSMEGTNQPSMEGASRPSMGGPIRRSMEGASRQSIDGHPSSLPSEIPDTTAKKVPGSLSDESRIEGNGTHKKTEMSHSAISPNRQASTEASKTYNSTETSNIPSTNVAPNIPPTNVASNILSTNVAPNISLTNVAPNISSTNVAPNIPPTKVASNIPHLVSENISKGNSAHSIEKVSKQILSASDRSTDSSSNTNSGHTQPGQNIVNAGDIEAGSVPPCGVKDSPPKSKRDNLKPSKRPIVFSTRTKPPAMAMVMPLQTQKTKNSNDNEFRNDFGISLASSQCPEKSNTEQKEVFQGHSTHVKTPVVRDSEEDEETEVKQVASVSPLSRMDVEPDCQNESETFLKSYSRAGLTETDQDDQAVSKVLEMGFPKTDIKAALLSLQSRAPGRRHFSVPNLLDEMDQLQQRTNPLTSQMSNDVETDGPSDAGFVLLTEESSRHQGSNVTTNYAPRHNRGSPNSQDSSRFNTSSPSSASPSKDKEKCTVS